MSPRRPFGRWAFERSNQLNHSQSGDEIGEEAGKRSVTAVADVDEVGERGKQGESKERSGVSDSVGRGISKDGDEVDAEQREGSGMSVPLPIAQSPTLTGTIFSDWFHKNPENMPSGYVGQVRSS